RVDPWRRRNRRRSGVAHEALERRNHRGRLLGRGRRGDDLELGAAVDHRPEGNVHATRGQATCCTARNKGPGHLLHGRRPTHMPELAVLDHDAVLTAVSAEAAIEHVRAAFVEHHRGEWTMPPKGYLPSPPHGDFRAMP